MGTTTNVRNESGTLEIHLGKGARRKEPHDEIIQDLERELTDGDQKKESHQEADLERLSSQAEQEDQRKKRRGE